MECIICHQEKPCDIIPGPDVVSKSAHSMLDFILKQIPENEIDDIVEAFEDFIGTFPELCICSDCQLDSTLDSKIDRLVTPKMLDFLKKQDISQKHLDAFTREFMR